MEVVVQFGGEWLERKGAAAAPILKCIEEWARGLDGVTFVQGDQKTLKFTMEAERKPAFRDELFARLKDVHGVADPGKVVSFQGDAPETAEAKPAPDPKQTLEAVLKTVPARYAPDIAAVFREIAGVIPVLKQMNAVENLWRQSLLIAIDDGYGSKIFLKALTRLLVSFGLAAGGSEKSVTAWRMTRTRQLGGESAEDSWSKVVHWAVQQKKENGQHPGSHPVLYLDIGAWQDGLDTTEAKKALNQLKAMRGDFLLVFRVPFAEEHVLKRIEMSLADVLNIRPVVVPPISVESATDYARGALAERAFTLEDSAIEPFEQWLLEERSDNSFFGYTTLDKMVDRIIYEKALSCMRSGTMDRSVGADDLKAFLRLTASPEEDPYAELDGLVGMDGVKQRVREIVALIKTSQKSAKRGKKAKRPCIHMLFSGNPGTGKTTVARLVARILKLEGVLRKGHLREVCGRDLCGTFVGQTAPKTSAICRDAYGSVLFIDEAYSLFRNGHEDSHDYGREALDTLVAEMENHRSDLCVILAGYPDEMQTMLTGNAGLKSRVPYEIEFPNYSRAEMVRIFMAMAADNFTCEPGLEAAVKAYFDAIPEDVLQAKEFSNARFVRNLYERTWGKAAYRSRLDAGVTTLLKSDLEGATAEREFTQLFEKKDRHTIGFA